MTDSLNLIMVNTIVKKAIRDIRTDPERTTRNLIDMALNFADSRFQKQFYSSAQRLLTNENSGYYGAHQPIQLAVHVVPAEQGQCGRGKKSTPLA